MNIVYSDSIQSQLDFIDAQIQATCERVKLGLKEGVTNIPHNQELIEIAKNDIRAYQETKAKILEIAIPKFETSTEEAKQHGIYKEDDIHGSTKQ